MDVCSCDSCLKDLVVIHSKPPLLRLFLKKMPIVLLSLQMKSYSCQAQKCTSDECCTVVCLFVHTLLVDPYGAQRLTNINVRSLTLSFGLLKFGFEV